MRKLQSSTRSKIFYCQYFHSRPFTRPNIRYHFRNQIINLQVRYRQAKIISDLVSKLQNLTRSKILQLIIFSFKTLYQIKYSFPFQKSDHKPYVQVRYRQSKIKTDLISKLQNLTRSKMQLIIFLLKIVYQAKYSLSFQKSTIKIIIKFLNNLG